MISAYEKWYARVQDVSAVWEEREIMYFRRAVGVAGISDPRLRARLRELFADTAYKIGYRITRDQSEKGRAYLLSKSLKRDGSFRLRSRLGEAEVAILRNLDHHLLVGLEQMSPSERFLPVYRAVARDGRYFEYVGGYYELVEVVAIGRAAS